MASSRKAEHDDEIEVLQSIYPEELNLIETEPFNKFSITLKGQPPQEIDDVVECELYFEHTEDYPDQEPTYEIRECVGISDSQFESLQQTFSETIEQNIGMPMIFTIISEVRFVNFQMFFSFSCIIINKIVKLVSQNNYHNMQILLHICKYFFVKQLYNVLSLIVFIYALEFA